MDPDAIAQDVVDRLAPRPSEDDATAEELADYDARYTRATGLVAQYLRQGGHMLSGKTLSGVGSRSFKDDREVRRLVRDIMAGFYVGAGRSVPIL